jgi:hypothetical protein
LGGLVDPFQEGGQLTHRILVLLLALHCAVLQVFMDEYFTVLAFVQFYEHDRASQVLIKNAVCVFPLFAGDQAVDFL